MNNQGIKHIISLLILSAVTLASRTAFPATSGATWYRVEGGLSLSGDYGKFDETKSGTVYENSLYGYSIGGFFRAGARFNILTVGLAGTVDGLSGSLGRRTDTTVGSNPTYDYMMLQGLAGGFVGLTLWGDANGPEIFGEYYGVAHRTVTTKENSTSGSPLQTHDALNGHGWGAGLSFVVDPRFRFGLIYRKLTFDRLNLSGTADPVTRDPLQAYQGMIFISRRL